MSTAGFDYIRKWLTLEVAMQYQYKYQIVLFVTKNGKFWCEILKYDECFSLPFWETIIA